mgnify:CR=1 FL=1
MTQSGPSITVAPRLRIESSEAVDADIAADAGFRKDVVPVDVQDLRAVLLIAERHNSRSLDVVVVFEVKFKLQLPNLVFK